MGGFEKIFNTQDDTPLFDPVDIGKNSGISAVAYFGILFFVPMLVDKNSRFARYHANQGLVLLLTMLVVGFAFSIISFIIGLVPIIGSLIISITSFGLSVISLGLMIFGIINAAGGKAKELPLIGGIKLIKI